MDYKRSSNQQNENQHVQQNSYTAKTSYQKLDASAHADKAGRGYFFYNSLVHLLITIRAAFTKMLTTSEITPTSKPVNKRAKKRNVLISLTLLGFLIWILIVLANSVKPSNNVASSMHLSEQLITLPMPLLQDARHANTGFVVSKRPDLSKTRDHNAIKLQQQRLTQLRMHNVLRGANRLPNQDNVQQIHSKYSELSSGREEKLSYLNAQQTDLVKRWEWEFQNGSKTK